tara:strand:- start:1061 stop:1831 length:771 start_codon:yes stop_codon:yes gene_type:complete
MYFKILGCGSSMGVPRSDGFFGKCNPKNKKNFRTRCSAILQSKYNNILIDASPDLRNQLITNKIKKIDKVLFSHMHADQTHGINDLRIFYLKKQIPIPVYADIPTKNYLKKTFSYCFSNKNKQYPPILKLNSLKSQFAINDGNKKIFIKSIKVRHGKVDSICYIFNNKLAYISDVSEIYKKDFKYFYNLNYLIIDCLRYQNHPSHLNLKQCLHLIKIFAPKKTILTNLHSDLDYDHLKKKLPSNVIPGYDGLRIKL